MCPYTFHMTGSGESLSTDNAQRTFPGADTYTKVPWLMVYSWGPGLEEVATALAAQCVARGADIVDIQPVDELKTPDDVAKYTVVVFVVSGRNVTSGDVKAKQEVAAVMRRYRSRRRDDFGAVLTGRQRYAFAGVIQVVVLDEETSTKPGAALSALLDNACDVHHVRADDAELPDLFTMFDGRMTPPHSAAPVPRPVDHVGALWAEAHAWGVDTPEDVHGIMSLIDGERPRWLSKQHTAPGAKHPDHPGLGALDMALDFDDVWEQRPAGMPEDEYDMRKKNFTNVGARAVRLTILRVQKTYPRFGRPDGRDGTKFNRPAFRMIYSTLLVLQRRLDNDSDAAIPTD